MILMQNEISVVKICNAVVSLALLTISFYFTVLCTIAVKMGAVAYIHDEKLRLSKEYDLVCFHCNNDKNYSLEHFTCMYEATAIAFSSTIFA